jgi:hypothetical protein
MRACVERALEGKRYICLPGERLTLRPGDRPYDRLLVE